MIMCVFTMRAYHEKWPLTTHGDKYPILDCMIQQIGYAIPEPAWYPAVILRDDQDVVESVLTFSEPEEMDDAHAHELKHAYIGHSVTKAILFNKEVKS